MRTKALQWQKTSDTVLCWARTVLGSYRVWKVGADGEWDWSFEGYDAHETFIGKVPTEEAAKVAAQSHFGAAIASVLEDDWQGVRIVFSHLPDHDPPRFIEVDDADGKSIRFGEWRTRPDGLAELVLPSPPKAGE